MYAVYNIYSLVKSNPFIGKLLHSWIDLVTYASKERGIGQGEKESQHKFSIIE